MSRQKELFSQMAAQYYVAGRFAAICDGALVCGNLFHHALELYLKAALVDSLGADKLKDKYGHKLKKLWEEVRAADPVLARFDGTIADIDRFEDIRYPDAIAGKGVVYTKVFDPTKPPFIALDDPSQHYKVVVHDIDNLVIAIVDLAGLEMLHMEPNSDHAHAALTFNNPHSERWSTKVKERRELAARDRTEGWRPL